MLWRTSSSKGCPSHASAAFAAHNVMQRRRFGAVLCGVQPGRISPLPIDGEIMRGAYRCEDVRTARRAALSLAASSPWFVIASSFLGQCSMASLRLAIKASSKQSQAVAASAASPDAEAPSKAIKQDKALPAAKSSPMAPQRKRGKEASTPVAPPPKSGASRRPRPKTRTKTRRRRPRRASGARPRPRRRRASATRSST